MESWEIVKDFEDYIISENGDVMRDGCYLQPTVSCGSYKVTLSKKGVRYNRNIRQLVYNTFVGEVPRGYCITTFDGNLLNHKLSNLQLISRSDLAKKRQRPDGYTTLDSKTLEQIKKRINEGVKYRDISEHFCLSISTISKIKNGKRDKTNVK